MKRNFTKLLIISIIFAIIITIINTGFCLGAINNTDYEPFSTTKGIVNEVNQLGSDNPGSGWYLLVAGGTSLFAEAGIILSYFIIFIVVVGIPAFILFLVIIFQGIARVFQIGTEKKWKNITSKVFTYISSVLLVLLCLVLFYEFYALRNFLLFIAWILSLIFVIVFVKELIAMKKYTADIAE